MSDDYFLDSNVFIYLFDDVDERKRRTAGELVERAIEKRHGSISHQVVQEVLNVLTTKLTVPLAADEAREFMNVTLAPLWRINPSRELYARALDYRERLRYGFYDALIVAAAVTGGCTTLYTEDLQNGREIDGTTIVNPFGEG